jgi:NADH-quinone oxidoreductase subunit G
MEAMGPWDGDRPVVVLGKEPRRSKGRAGALALSTWKQLLDPGSMQDGDPHLAATRRPAVALVSPATLAGLSGATDTEVRTEVALTGDRGSITLPVRVVADMVDGVVWLPSVSARGRALADLASPGSTVTAKGAGK